MKNSIKKLGQWMVNPISLMKGFLVLILLINVPGIDDYIRLVLKAIPFWALLIISVNYKKILNVNFEKRYWLLVAMSFSYAITVFVNMKSNFVQNAKAEMWFLIYVAILFCGWRYSDRTSYDKDIICICKVVIILNAINVVPSVVLFLFKICYVFEKEPHGYFAAVGRLYGIVSGVNPSAMVSAIAILCFFYIASIKQKKTFSVLFFGVIHTVVNYIYIVATGSRSAQIALIAAVSFAVGNVFINKLWGEKDNEINAKDYFVAIACYLIVFATIMSSVFMSKELISKMEVDNPTIQDYLEITIEKLGGVVVDNTGDATLRTEESEIASSVHRLGIWLECFELWKEYPIWGIGAANANDYANLSEREFRHINIGGVGASTHGMPVAVLLYSGIIGSLIFAVFMIIEFCKLIKNIYDMMLHRVINTRVTIAFMICSMLLVYSIFSTMIVFSNVQGSILFWVFLGIVEQEQSKVGERKNNL